VNSSVDWPRTPVADWPDRTVSVERERSGERLGTFVAAEKHFWKDGVREVLSVAAYDPD